jgi:hypothetical protein
MKAFCRALCVLLAAASFFAPPACATSFSTDQSDLWYIPAESGWGVQLVQRGAVIFATLFVYGQANVPTWFVSTMQVTGTGLWSGDLFATTGPYFGTVPFKPSNVVATKVGTMTWNGTLDETGILTYTVNGVSVTKNVTRETLVFDDFSGHYFGAIHRVVSGCSAPGFNGTFENTGIINVVQDSQTQAITVTAFPEVGGTCTYPGTLQQFGQMGEVNGSYSCTDAEAGTFHMYEMQVNPIGFTARLTVTDTSAPASCQSVTWFGGVRVTTFGFR